MSSINKQVFDVFSSIWNGYQIDPVTDFMSDIAFVDVATESYKTDTKLIINLQNKYKIESWSFAVYKKYDDKDHEVTVSVDHLSYLNIDTSSHPSKQHYELKIDDDHTVYYKGNKCNQRILLPRFINFFIDKQNEFDSYFIDEE